FAAIDATNDPVWRQVLQQRYGITLVGDRLGFPVRVGDAAFNDGVARIEVDGLGMLGVRLEVTLLSQAQGPAPTAGGGTPPSTRPLGDRQVLGNMGNLITNDGASLITNDGGSLIGQDGASLITNDGGSFINHVNGIVAQGGGNILTDNGNLLLAGAGNGLITNDGGSLISNDGGGLIALNAGGSLTGLVADPGQAAGTGPGGNGKFALLSVPATPALGSAVKAIDGLGAQFGPTAFTDATGRYKIQRLPITWNGLIVQAQVGTDVLRTLAPAPGKRTIQANLSAATSGIAAVVLDGQAASPGQTLGISRGAYQADTDTLDGLMTLADARFMVSNGTPAVASYVRGLFTAAGKTMALSLPAGPPATPTPAPTATPTPAPSASPNGFGTSLTCDPGTELQIHGLGLPAGMVGLRVTIGGLAAPISRVVGANDFFIIIPANIPIASTTLSIFYAPGGTGPESNIWNWAIDVNPPAATTFSLQVAGGNPARGTTLAMAGAGLPPQAQLQVTIGGVVQPISLATGSILQVTVDSTTPLGPQPLVITWYDPASGARVVLFDTITIL
ncbi:MAG: hypothetical protein JWM80_4465, partial [Cyanobacteria bacterium RYN_339]|nr:hypothetical protein [Cyanobacteria bacterium RYN_339]